MKHKRTVISIIICALAAILLISGCGAIQHYLSKAGIMGYRRLKEADIDHVDNIGGVDYHVGKLNGEDVVITKAGIGKVMSSSGVTTMLNNYKISRVLFTGIAGGVGNDTQVLDEVVATRLVQHDFGMTTDDGFKWYEGYDDLKKFYECDEDLVNFAYNAAVEVVGEEHAFKGTIATGDQFIASEKYVKTLQEEFDALACEMEGAAVAMVCEEYDVPYVVIRAMSDKADGKAHETYENMADIAADNSSRILIRMMEDLQKQ